MTDGDEPFKPVLLKAEVPKHVSEKLDEMAKDMGFSTRAKLIRHIIDQYLNPQATFQEYERIDPGMGNRGQPRQEIDMSELTAVLHTLNKSLDQSAAQTGIIARQNETIHQLVNQNEKLVNTQTTLWGNERPALSERSQVTQEQDQTRTEVVEDRTEPPKDSPEVEQTRTEMGTTEEQDEPQDRQPLTGGDVLTVLEAETLAMSLGVKVSKDTFRRATTEKHGGKLLAVPDRKTLGLYTQDVRAFIEAWKVGGSLKTMPQIRDGKPLE
jgi:hypothetical protein